VEDADAASIHFADRIDAQRPMARLAIKPEWSATKAVPLSRFLAARHGVASKLPTSEGFRTPEHSAGIKHRWVNKNAAAAVPPTFHHWSCIRG
jgi:hypothetical protein